MTTYWNRTMREIENGTYRKDVAKVSRRLAQKGAPLTEQEALALGIPASRARALIARQASRMPVPTADAAPPAPAAGAPTTPTPPSPPTTTPTPPPARTPARPSGIPGMTEDDLAALHRRYDEAARAADRPAPSLAKLREQLTKHVPQVMAQLGTDQVTFDVAVKDGRVVLRPKPRK
jgi:hypothetical protein